MAFGLERQIQGLGKIDKGQLQGFYLHPVLTRAADRLDADTGACHGVAPVEFGVRSFEDDGLSLRQRKAAADRLPLEDKESYRWKRSIQAALPHLPATAVKTVVADRESDIYAVLVGLQHELGLEYVIRSRIDRPLSQGANLLATVTTWPLVGTYEVTLPAHEQRPAHQARLWVRAGRVSVKKSAGKSRQPLPKAHSTGVVWVRQDPATVPVGQPPIDWVLLTSHPVSMAEVARQVIDIYRQRWLVEQLFRSLKSKCLRFESSQLSTLERLGKLMVVALMGAVKVLQLVRAREGTTPQVLEDVFGQREASFLQALSPRLEGRTDKLKNPFPPRSLAFGAWVIARLAGWSGYASQRPAGPTDFLVGLQRFYEQWQGYELASHLRQEVVV